MTRLRRWPARRWLTAAGVAVGTYLVVALPTALVENPIFSREIAPTWWAVPVLAVTAVLAGLLTATYVAIPVDDSAAPRRSARLGSAGALITFFAVGCPVCNKLVLLALGTGGALQFFEPVQPYLAGLSIVLLGWALYRRISNEDSCSTGIPVKSPEEVQAEVEVQERVDASSASR